MPAPLLMKMNVMPINDSPAINPEETEIVYFSSTSGRRRASSHEIERAQKHRH